MPKQTSWSYTADSRRSTVFGAKGMICGPQPLASAAGLEILGKGGNAVDAAIAVAAALNVTEPCNCGIGGDVFALYYEAATGKVHALNGSGKSPAGLTIEMIKADGIGGERFPYGSPHAVTVPWAVGAWVKMREEWSKSGMALDEILEPAARLAEEGFPVHQQCAYEWGKGRDLLCSASKGLGEETYPYLLDGKPPKAGEWFDNPALGKTLRKIGQEGMAGFYAGEVAQAIVDAVQSRGGKMTLDDLAQYEAEVVQPISYTYGADKHTIWECPPNGQGLAALIAFGIVDALRETRVVDPDDVKEGSAQWYHVLVEAMRLAYADAQRFIADPSIQHVPVDELLSKAYLAERAKLFNPTKATAQFMNGNPIPSSDTVYFATADSEGNAVSMIMSNYAGFGTGIVPPDCGFSLQNRGVGFILNDPTHPNAYAPSKRPYHTIIPAMVTQGSELVCAYGVMGGYMQPQGHLQVLANIIHHGHSPQASMDAKRFCVGGSRPNLPGEEKWWNRIVALEHGVDPDVVRQLVDMGHKIDLVQGDEQVLFGKGQIIQRRVDARTGKALWAAGSDPRCDGAAVAQI